MPQVILFSLPPRRLRDGIGIGAAFDDVRDPISEFSADVFQTRLSALVLDGIMQQSRNRFVLIAVVGKHYGSYAKKMTDIRARGSLAELLCVHARRIRQRTVKTPAKRTSFWKLYWQRDRIYSRLRIFESSRNISK